MAFRQIRDASARNAIIAMVKKQAKAGGKSTAPAKNRRNQPIQGGIVIR